MNLMIGSSAGTFSTILRFLSWMLVEDISNNCNPNDTSNCFNPILNNLTFDIIICRRTYGRLAALS